MFLRMTVSQSRMVPVCKRCLFFLNGISEVSFTCNKSTVATGQVSSFGYDDWFFVQLYTWESIVVHCLQQFPCSDIILGIIPAWVVPNGACVCLELETGVNFSTKIVVKLVKTFIVNGHSRINASVWACNGTGRSEAGRGLVMDRLSDQVFLCLTQLLQGFTPAPVWNVLRCVEKLQMMFGF